MNILLAGGSGFLGTHLAKHLLMDGHVLSFLSRTTREDEAYHYWNPYKNEIDPNALIDKDVVINLSGAGIAKQLWTKSYKKRILESRIQSTRLLVNSIAKLEKPPQLFINSSAIGYYGNQPGIELDEKCKPGTDFLASTCVAWEKEVQKLDNKNIPYAILRIGIVLGKGGGSLPRLQLPLKLGINVLFGKGNQFISWIHVSDFSYTVEKLIRQQLPPGLYNLVSMNPVTQKVFNKSILNRLGKKSIQINIPVKLMHLVLGEMACLLTNDQKVRPAMLNKHSFKFQFNTIEEAIEEINC